MYYSYYAANKPQLLAKAYTMSCFHSFLAFTWIVPACTGSSWWHSKASPCERNILERDVKQQVNKHVSFPKKVIHWLTEHEYPEGCAETFSFITVLSYWAVLPECIVPVRWEIRPTTQSYKIMDIYDIWLKDFIFFHQWIDGFIFFKNISDSFLAGTNPISLTSRDMARPKACFA